MKNLLLLLIVPFFIACNSDDSDAEEININPKEYIVSLGVTGEITDITEEPLKATNNNDLYGFQVYSSLADKDTYEPYAYGLFDNISSLSIKLNEGYKYKFICTYIVDGKSKIYFYGGGYGLPFFVSSSMPVNTEFNYGKTELAGIRRGLSSQSNNAAYRRPQTDRYYGESSEYLPSENGRVAIPLKRTSFGVKVVADKSVDGSLTVDLGESPLLKIEEGKVSAEAIYSFDNVLDAWLNDNHTEEIPVSISWNKKDGAVVPLATKPITVKRNKLTTIKITVKDNSSNNGVDVSTENPTMGDGGSVSI